MFQNLVWLTPPKQGQLRSALKQPQKPQILGQNCTKTTGSNDLGPMANH